MKNVQTRLTVLAASVAALTMSLSLGAQAAVVGAADNSFYDYPTSIPEGNPGTLISYRNGTAKIGTVALAAKAYNVVYKSTDSTDLENVVAGTVLVPTAAWTGGGARPVILYAVGTHGLASGCAPSRQLANGTDYEGASIQSALNAGYTVLVTDYAGSLTGDASTYLSGKSEGHAVLDIFRAAQSVPNSGVTASSKVGIWGFSQGGQAAAWAAEILKTYAPEINVVGVAAGGIPANFIDAAHKLDGDLGAAFLFSGVAGLNYQYPDTLNIDLIASDVGFAALDRLKTQCVFEALFENQNKSLTAFTKNNITLDQILRITDIKNTLVEQNLGTATPTVPMYLFHGLADEFIATAQTVNLKNTYCQTNKNVYFDMYPSEHIVTQFQAAGPALAWMADRFNGKAAPNTCANTAASPASTAIAGPDLQVKLDKWSLGGSLKLKTLGQTVTLPEGGNLTAVANITQNKLNGTMVIPEFKQRISLIGINAQVGIKVTPLGPVTGSNSLDNAGVLHIKATVPTDITVTSVWGVPFGACKTVSPVIFPITFDGPLASLGNGNLKFGGTVDFPQIKGCIISAIISGLMSGKGQGFEFVVAPPAPTKF
jgi:hypothetical protein